MKKPWGLVRKVLVGVVGFPLLLLGIILIPLPGPGVLISLLAFFILSLEFDWAEKHFTQAKNIIKKIWDNAQERAARFEEPKEKPNTEVDREV